MLLSVLIAAAPPIEMYQLPRDEPVSTTLDEAALARQGAAVATQSGRLTASETEGLRPALDAAYAELTQERGAFPSPALRRQAPEAFDLVVIRPETVSPASAAAIFLHGFGGNWSLECWLFARGSGMLTVCPSTTMDAR